MKASHRQDNRQGRQLDILTDEQNAPALSSRAWGEELIGLASVNEAGEWAGFPYYRDNDLSAPYREWANHAPVMGYYLHRLKNGKSSYRCREIKGGTHSFLRSKTWHFAGSTVDESASLKYRITPKDSSPTEYPLTSHVAFGLHPGFGAASFESFRLQMPPGCYRRYFSQRQLSLWRNAGLRFFRCGNAASQ